MIMNDKVMIFYDIMPFSLIVGCQYFVGRRSVYPVYIDSSVFRNVGACLPEYSALHTGRLFLTCRYNCKSGCAQPPFSSILIQ
jgi:hypothetical protein